MTTASTTEDLISKLYRIKGQAEIVDRAIIRLPFHAPLIARACGEITAPLYEHSRQHVGTAFTATVGYVVNLPRRKSFCADASYYTGPPGGMEFLQEPPVFAAEVRDKEDYGRVAEQRIAAKRSDYFAAGTRVVWDVDLLSEDVVRVYRAEAPGTPTIFKRGDTANAEPAVPGWTMPVDELFE